MFKCIIKFNPACFINGLVFTQDLLTLKVPITTAADDIHKYFFIVFFFSEKKNQALSSSKDKSKKNKISYATIFVWHFKG